MTFFYTAPELAGVSETFEPGVNLATAYSLGPGSIGRFSWPWPAVAPDPAPTLRCWIDGVEVLGGLAFDTSAVDAVNIATPLAPIVWGTAATVVATVSTTRYTFISGFFSGGPVTRGSITALGGRFGPQGSEPTSTTTLAFPVDIDYTPAAAEPISADLAAVLPAVAGSLSADVVARAALAGTLPAIVADLAAALRLTAQLAGNLPALVAALTNLAQTEPGALAAGGSGADLTAAGIAGATLTASGRP